MQKTRAQLPVTPECWRLWLDDEFAFSPTTAGWQAFHNGPHSRVYRVDGKPASIAKLAMPRSLPRDAVRKYGACQAYREYRGNLVLAALGLRAPAVFGWGMTPNPLSAFESVLFMEALPPFASGLAVIRQEHSEQTRLDFLRRFAAQLGRLHAAGYAHMDCHFGNVGILSDHTLVWIDNDIRRPRSWRTCRKGLRKTLAHLHATARGTVTPAEWDQFDRALRTALASSPNGARLLHELL